MDTYYPESYRTHLNHGIRSVEKLKKRFGENFEGDDTEYHHGRGIYPGKLPGIHHTLSLSCTVVVCDYRDHAVVETEYGHEYETLKFKVYTEYRNCRGRKGEQYLI